MNRDSTAALARAITRRSSTQTYYTARLMVDKDLVDDFCRAYAYFRWADDVVHAPVSGDLSSMPDDQRLSFVRRQRELIDRLYSGERPEDLAPEEEIVADLIRCDREKDSGLQSFIRNMFAVVKFDAYRKGRLVGEQELARYSNCLAQAVVDGLQYFVGHGHSYPVTEDRLLAALGAHRAHLLRDMVQDMIDGFVNIPREYLEAHGIGPEDVESLSFRAWVRERVEQVRQDFCAGKRYLDDLEVLRCKIVGYWYCARFEGVLDAIERDRYVLRAGYSERHKLSTWLKVAWIAASVTLGHVARAIFRGAKRNRWPPKQVRARTKEGEADHMPDSV
jgi:phytoene/squalene synthetase